jgi:hypothetical protein
LDEIKIHKKALSLKQFITLSVTILSFQFAFSQMGGSSVYEILNLPVSAKVAGTGGYNVSMNSGDPSIGYFNPSVIDSTYKNNIGSGWGALFMDLSDISYGYASYANKFKKYNYAANLVIINYGKITARDESGNNLGTDIASEYVLSLGASEDINKWLTWGISAKPVMSYLANYSSYAIASDIGLTYHDSLRNTNVSIVARNVGFQIKPYYKGSSEKLPFEIDLGYTKKFEHAPFRLSVTYRHLQKFDLSYKSTLQDNSVAYLADTTSKSGFSISDIASKFTRHLIFGAEFLIGKRFYVNLGYNVKRKNELKSASNGGLVGMTYGAGIKISKFTFGFAHQKYNVSGGATTFTMLFNLNDAMSLTNRKSNPKSSLEAN